MSEIWHFFIIAACRYILKVRNPELFQPYVCSQKYYGEILEALTRELSDEVLNVLQISLLNYVILIYYKNFQE